MRCMYCMRLPRCRHIGAKALKYVSVGCKWMMTATLIFQMTSRHHKIWQSLSHCVTLGEALICIFEQPKHLEMLHQQSSMAFNCTSYQMGITGAEHCGLMHLRRISSKSRFIIFTLWLKKDILAEQTHELWRYRWKSQITLLISEHFLSSLKICQTIKTQSLLGLTSVSEPHCSKAVKIGVDSYGVQVSRTCSLVLAQVQYNLTFTRQSKKLMIIAHESQVFTTELPHHLICSLSISSSTTWRKEVYWFWASYWVLSLWKHASNVTTKIWSTLN